MKRSIVLTVVLALVTLGMLATPLVAAAQGPGDNLSKLTQHLDTAMARVAAGDPSGARSELAAFSAGWRSIEDGIHAQSPTSYAAIETAMGDAGSALSAVPFNAQNASQALERLDAACDAFIAGSSTPSTAASATSSAPVTLPSAVGRLNQALALLDKGNVTGAAEQIGSFRQDWLQVEGQVATKSPQVYADTENNMARAYGLLTQQPPDTAAARATISRMKTDLTPLSQGGTHYGAFDAAVILLREGLEALLVVGALLAFLKKTNNADKGRWIWAGSGTGILASLLVAIVVNVIFSRAAAGVNRELLEGLTGLVAAAMLVYMSYWLHSKANMNAWQSYIRQKSTAALARNSIVSLALIAFLAVFREGAETVLFYVGISPSITAGDLALGLGIGAAGLALVGVLVFVFGVRLPIRPFFLGTSVLIYYLAFKFVGTGIHSLQVAGVIRATTAGYLPENSFLGLFPTWETTGVQLVLLVLALVVLAARRLRPVTSLEQRQAVRPPA